MPRPISSSNITSSTDVCEAEQPTRAEPPMTSTPAQNSVEAFKRRELALAATQSFPFEGACFDKISQLKPGEFLEVSLAGEVTEGLKVNDEGRARVERRPDGTFTVEMLAALSAGQPVEKHLHTKPGELHQELEGMAKFEIRAGTTLHFETAEAAADYCGAACEAGCHVANVWSSGMEVSSLAISGYALLKHVANGENPLAGAAEQRVAHYLKHNATEFKLAGGVKLEAEGKRTALQAELAIGVSLGARVDLESHVVETSFGVEGEGKLALNGAMLALLENQRGFGANVNWKVGVTLVREEHVKSESQPGAEPEYFVEVEAERTGDATLYVAEFKRTDTVKVKVPLHDVVAAWPSQSKLAALFDRAPAELTSVRVENDNAVTAGFDIHVAALTAQAQHGSVSRFEGSNLENALDEARRHEHVQTAVESHRALAALHHGSL